MSTTPLRICVLSASYAESSGALKEVEGGYEVNPAHYFAPRWPPAGKPNVFPHAEPSPFTFELVPIEKRTAYSQIRALVSSGKYDCFYNLCDGAKDEDRAGVEVIAALEEFGVPFTGSTSFGYERSKTEMKMVMDHHGVRTPRGVTVRSADEVTRKCAKLRFPVIVKHVSGYSSVGMTKKSKCTTLDELRECVTAFIVEYKSALVEEFIEGDEATILVCADPTAPGGIRAYPPVQMNFPEGEDFKHFDLKWNSFDDMSWFSMDPSHPAYHSVMEVGKLAFKYLLDGAGYGRSDVRIDRVTGEVFFLELNPNPGSMYPYGDEGSCDWILRLYKPNGEGHREFIELQIRAAIEAAERRRPVYACVQDDESGEWVMVASEAIRKGRIVFQDEGRAVRLFTRDFVAHNWHAKDQKLFRNNAWPMGCDQHVYAVWDKDPTNWRPISHSCSPNLAFASGRSLNVEAVRDIAADEKLTMDFRTFMDASMDPFTCRCGSANCVGRVEVNQTPSFLEGNGKTIRSFHRPTPFPDVLPLEGDSDSSRSDGGVHH